MKIRNGFVSNSSSSSFCIYGIDVGDNRADVEAYEDKIKDLNLNLEVHYGEYSKFLGRSWSAIGDDETGKAFKNSIHSDLAQLGITPTCGTIEESWYNG